MFKGNGNALKGNNQKKIARKIRKDEKVEFDSELDQYARVVCIQGGKHVTVHPLGNAEKDYISANIRGIHHKKVWFKPDDFVVIRNIENFVEIQGKVTDADMVNVKQTYEKLFKKNDRDTDIGFDIGDNADKKDDDSIDFDKI